jgi:glutaredoxin 3
MMARVELYSTPFCGACVVAKKLLRSKNVPFTEIDVSERFLRDAMAERAKGNRSVPQIFIDDRHVGGCDELIEFDFAGKLEALRAP